MNFKTFALAAVAAVGLSGAASAATLQVLKGGSPVDFSDTLPGNYNPTPGGAFSDPVEFFQQGDGVVDNCPVCPRPYRMDGGLFLTSEAILRFTFLGKEAAFTNEVFEFFVDGVFNKLTNLDAEGTSFEYTQGAGAVLFEFITNTAGTTQNRARNNGGWTSDSLGIFFGKVSERSYFVGLGDGTGDNDFDDMVIRIDVVPLPASALLLLGGLGGIAALKRRRKTA